MKSGIAIAAITLLLITAGCTGSGIPERRLYEFARIGGGVCYNIEAPADLAGRYCTRYVGEPSR